MRNQHFSIWPEAKRIMEIKSNVAKGSILSILLASTALLVTTQASATPARPKGPCDIYAAAGTPCVAAHSSTRALYAAYNGPLYQVLRQSDGKTRDIGVVQPSLKPVADAGGYADAAAQDVFCAHTTCWITVLYDQSGKHNDLVQAPRGGFSGPALGGFNNLPVADMAPVSVLGHKVYGVFIAPGMGLRQNDAKGTAVDDQAEGQYWVINGHHYNSGCCFDYGNAEIDSRDDGNGTMETTYYGNGPFWYHGNPPGPWIMTDQENNLVGCVNEDKSKLCKTLPIVSWRFVTAMAKGKPHRWTTLGGDAQRGDLAVMFDGPRIDATYDPMRKQGAILLGNGGDNSNGSQGTFYEGAMTAAGTFPSDATDQLVQANVVAAKYNVAPVSLVPASAAAMPPGLQTFVPETSQDTVLTFTNTTGAVVSGLKLSMTVPAGWTAMVPGTTQIEKDITGPIAPGASVSATFRVTPGPQAFNGEMVGTATWKGSAKGATFAAQAAEKVRNVDPIKINEFRVSAGSNANTTNSFIELYNAGSKPVDISNWSLTEHASGQAVFSAIDIPGDTTLAPGGFYLLGQSNSALAVPAARGDATVQVRSVAGMKVGDTIVIGTGADAETRKIAKLGTAAGEATSVWQPVPEGPVITIPAGSTNIPVASTTGFAVGDKIALGYGTRYPTVGRDVEKYEVATVTAVGKAGTQALLVENATAGATTLKVSSVADISVGDKIRLDIDSVGHGIETVTVKNVGTAAKHVVLATAAAAGETSIVVRTGFSPQDKITFAVGDKITIGTPASLQTVTITAVTADGPTTARLTLGSALTMAHVAEEDVIEPGTGLGVVEPLKFNHAANLPFSVRGTGISFTPASAYPHTSNEPVMPLGTGLTLDAPLAKNHAIEAVVQDRAVTTAGYQEAKTPNQWFGGPVLSVNAGSMILRDAAGHVVDSLNYGNFANNGNLVDAWAAEGYQAVSGLDKSGCFVTTPGAPIAFPPVNAVSTNSSAGRYPDGQDSDSNCTDFHAPAATVLPEGAAAGSNTIKVADVAGFQVGQSVLVDAKGKAEEAVISAVGSAGATTVRVAVAAGATAIPVADGRSFSIGQAITIGGGNNAETGMVQSVGFGSHGVQIIVTTPLKNAHVAGTEISGTGITLAKALSRAHDKGAEVTTDLPTPGAANKYSGK